MKKIKRKPYFYIVLFLLTVALTACTTRPNFKLYDGKSLRVAVIGEPPEVKEKQVSFKKISFNDMKRENLNSYDAVFITKENLNEAAEDQYADIYLSSRIPFFFIQSTKSYLPFVYKGMKYDEPKMEPDNLTYATGFLGTNGGKDGKFWGYGLYNDEVNSENIKNVYSRVFSTIAQNEETH